MATQENLEIILFNNAVGKCQWYLKIIGFQVDDLFCNRSFWKRLRLWSVISISLIFLTEVGQLTWFLQNASSGTSFVQLTNVATCVIFCLLSNIQSFYFIKYGRQVYQLIEDVRTLQSMQPGNPMDESDEKFIKSQIKFLNIAVHGLGILIPVGVFSFGVSPLVTIVKNYYNTGELNLILPFLLAFPFDTNDITFWLIAYIFEIWSGQSKVRLK